MVWCLCCTILLHKLCQSYVFPASDLCRDVPIFLWVLLMLKGMRLAFFSVFQCVLMITKRVSFHFHHGKRQVWDVSLLNVADSAHLRPWMQAWILHVFPSRLPVACFFLRDECHICRVWWWGGGGCQLIRNGHWIYGAEFICMKLKEQNAGKPSLSVVTFLLVLSCIPTSPPKLVSFQIIEAIFQPILQLFWVSTVSTAGDAMMEPFQLSSCLHCIVLRKLSIDPRLWNGSSELHVAWYEDCSKMLTRKIQCQLTFRGEVKLWSYSYTLMISLWLVVMTLEGVFDSNLWQVKDVFFFALWRIELFRLAQALQIRAWLKKFHEVLNPKIITQLLNISHVIPVLMMFRIPFGPIWFIYTYIIIWTHPPSCNSGKTDLSL